MPSKVKLRALEPEDLELLYTIENNPEMWTVGDNNTPYSHHSLIDYIASQQNDIYADKQLRLVIETTDSESVGLIDLFNFCPEHLRAEMGLAIREDQTGKGYAQDAIRCLQEYCQNKLHLHQMYCIVPEDNAPSMHMLLSTGFKECQTFKEWLNTGKGWKDCILYQYFF